MNENVVTKFTMRDDKYACVFADKIIAESQETDEAILSSTKYFIRGKAMLYRYYIDLTENTQEEKALIRDKIDGWEWTMSEEIKPGIGLVGLDITWEPNHDFDEFLKATGLNEIVKV